MKKYIFGFDAAQPERCAELLREKDYDAVVVGSADERVRRALSDSGLELYLCYGALGLRGEADPLAEDALGQARRWFGSGCPNSGAVADERLRAALSQVTDDVRGVFVDGARFASFASVEGAEGFFTCFCPRCMEKMAELGFDAARIRAAAGRLQTARKVSPEDILPLMDWMKFREASVQAYFDRFAGAVHGLRGDLQAGAFVFAPSLSGFVGQTARACRSLDVVAPMLYRAYPHEEGPACLGHEWAALQGLFGAESARFAVLGAGSTEALGLSPEALLREGLSPEYVGRETAAARGALPSSQRLWPILQIEDEDRAETARQALEGGADGVGYFMYGQAEL